MVLVQRIIVVPAATGTTVLVLMSSVLTTRSHVSLHFLFLLLFVVFLDSSGGTNAIVERCVLHAFHNRLATRIDFFRIIASKGSRNGRSVVHPAFQFELSNDLVFAVGFRPALGDLVSPHVWFVEIVDEVYGKLDQEAALQLGVVGVVEPIVKVSLGPKPQHGVSAVLDPKGLLPFFHDNRAKGDSRQDKALFANEFGLGKSRRLRSRYCLCECSTVRIADIFVVLVIPVIVVVAAIGSRHDLAVVSVVVVSVRWIVWCGVIIVIGI